MYLTFEEYTKMGGTLDETTFVRFSAKAELEINRYTFGRLKTENPVRNAVKVLCYELVELLPRISGVQVVSTSNDGVAEHYAQINYSNAVEGLIKTYLSDQTDKAGTPLLYRGFGNGTA